MQVNAILSSTDQSGKKQTTTITYLRESQKSKAATLTQALNALTTNTYVSTQVNEMNVDTTEAQNLPQEISVTYVDNVYTVHRLGTGTITVYYNNGTITIDQSTNSFVSNALGPFFILVDADGTYAQGYLVYTKS